MNRNAIIIGSGIGGGLLFCLAGVIGWQIAQPAMAYGATPTSTGIASLVMSIIGASGLSVTSLVAWLTGGRLTKSTPELLASLVAWMANKADKQLERRFVLAVLATLDELFVDQTAIRGLISKLGAAIVDAWLPSQQEVAK